MALGNRAHLSGLNIVGLQRRGFSREDIHNLRRAYRSLFADEGTLMERLGGRGEGVCRPRRSSRRSWPSSARAASARCARRREATEALSNDSGHVVSRGMGVVGILAGGGRLPLMIAESVAARGGSVHIVAHRGEARRRARALPAHLGDLGPDRPHGATPSQRWRPATRDRGARAPARSSERIRPDVGFFPSLPHDPRADGAGGDDDRAERVVRFFEAKGLDVRGGARDGAGSAGGRGRHWAGRGTPSDAGSRRCGLGFAVRARWGRSTPGRRWS